MDMSLDESEKKRVEELFLSYRDRYEKLRKLNEKKGKNSSNLSPSVKVLGEEMSSWTLTSEPFDFAIHTCGRKTYPDGLVTNNYYQNHWTFSTELNEAQNKLLRDSYKLLNLDLTIFTEAERQARGMWIEFIGESRRRRKIPTPNLTGQIGDVMGVLASNFSEILESVASDKVMKKIQGYDPLERKGVISDKLLELFVEQNYKCFHYEETECVLCGSAFYPQSQHEWVGLVPPIYCGICLEMGMSASTDFFRKLGFNSEERVENFTTGIQIYADYFGFIPSVSNQKRTVLSQLFVSGIDVEELNFAMKVSSLLPWKDTVSELFGSWAHLLEKSGLLSARQRGRGGHQSIASDGHHCLSLGERAICEFLTKNGMNHEKEPMYPHHAVLNPNGLLRGDFLVNGMIIEFAGMMSNSEYAERMAEKQKLAKALKIGWMKLEASSLNDLSSMLEKIQNKSRNIDQGV
jgi:hypothetical protein